MLTRFYFFFNLPASFSSFLRPPDNVVVPLKPSFDTNVRYQNETKVLKAFLIRYAHEEGRRQRCSR